MSEATAVAFGAFLAVVFLALIGVMLWQELRQRPSDGPVEFIIGDAVNWIWRELTAGQRARLTTGGVTAIVEWQVHGLQQSVKGQKVGDAEVIMGPTADSVAYIRAHAGSFESADVEAVLEAQGGYLTSIGAVAGMVEGPSS